MICGLNQPRDVGWCVRVARVNGLRCQDGSVALPESVGFYAVKIFLIAVCPQDKTKGAGRGHHVGIDRNYLFSVNTESG